LHNTFNTILSRACHPVTEQAWQQHLTAGIGVRQWILGAVLFTIEALLEGFGHY
jgi:hypothetical protein